MKKSIHQKIVQEIVEEQKKNKDVVAINIFGSVAKGKERSDSDVDIEIISSSAKKWQLLKQERYGIKIDFEIWPKDKLLKRIEKYPFLSYIFLKEKIVYDPDNFMKKIINKLKQYFKKHPEVVEFWENKLKIMKKNKKKGQDLKDAIKTYDEAEVKFSKEHKITRDFFRE